MYPLAYLAFSLTRGALVGWYPYPFLDPRPNGYLTVAVISLIIAFGCAVVMVLLTLSTRRRAEGMESPAAN